MTWAPTILERGAPGRASDRKPYAVLDIETDGLRGPLVSWSAVCECDPEHVTDGTTAESLWRHVLAHDAREHANREHIWWSHNGGSYDLLYLLPSAREAIRDGRTVVDPVMRQTDMIGMRVRSSKHRTDLRDSYALLPVGLADLSAQLAPHLPKLDIGLVDDVTFDPTNPEHMRYAHRDVQSLLAVLVRFRAILAERWDETLPSWSAASTALRAWTRTLADGERYRRIDRTADPIARAGYYGGIVELRSIDWHRDALTLDINSMYPTTMREAGVPAGWSWTVERFDRRRPGFYRCILDVPANTPFTFLPYRDPTGQLAWPTGRFPTVLTSAEIVAAREHGIGVRVSGGVVWERLAHPFDRYVGRVEALRVEGGALAVVGKLLGNGLYGKFGAKPLRDEWCLSADHPGPGWEVPPYDSFDEAAVEAHRGLWCRRDVPLRAPYLLPHWAAWITANARLRLLSLVDAIGPANVLYTDTDSVTAPAAAIDAAVAAGRATIGSAFGQAKIEHRWRRFRALAPKVYEGVEIGPDGADISLYKAKGIPRRLAAAAFDGGEVGWDSPNGSLAVLQGAPLRQRRTRHLSSIDGSLAWTADDAGVVRPVNLTY